MNLNPKFNVDQEVYVVWEYKVVKVRILEIVIRIQKTGSFIEYQVSPLLDEQMGKPKQKCFKECYLVGNFKDAKKAALENFKAITATVQMNLSKLSEEDFVYEEPKK